MIYNEEGDKIKIKHILHLLDKYSKNQVNNILNAGCGNNWMKKHVPKKISITGLDINNPNADLIADLEKKLPLKNNSYDAVILMHVIEHLESPINTLKELNRILKKNGLLFISTPSPWSNNAWEDPYHIRPYTTGSIKTLGKDAGFKTISSYYTNTTHCFGLLGLDQFQRIKYFYEHKIPLLNILNMFKGNTEVLLKKYNEKK